MNVNCIQLEMNFNGSTANRFKSRLDEGTFQVLLELTAPSADTKPEHAVKRLAEFEYLAASAKTPAAGLAFVDSAPSGASMDLVQFAAELCASGRDSHVLYLHGRDQTFARVAAEAGHAFSEGFKNFCAVSGASLPGEDVRHTSRRVFLESVCILRRLHESFGPNVLTGATVNPFKYTASDAYAQSFKLMKKVNEGASFLVTQYGWDMMKLQEFRWQLCRRSLHLPSLARLLFLTPERAENICSGKYPGITLSPDLEIVLRREMEHSSAQFAAAQIRRIQIHAAGARLLGYSGIQLAGVESPELFAVLLDRIREGLREFQKFDDWRTAYNEYYARLDMAPYPYHFYMFENLFETPHPPDELHMKDAHIPPCSSHENFLYRLSRNLFGHASELPASERRLTKKMIVGCRSCDSCRLPESLYVCPENCPKGMANGPCGCSRADGSCEFYPDRECLFGKRMRIANEYHDYLSLETPYVETPETRPSSPLK